ncbi:MAG: hypothetical protein EZS28_028766, partial [Streblomastix strix]
MTKVTSISPPQSPSVLRLLGKRTRAQISARYKTEMCRNFVETGRCQYGSGCAFAHSKNELRQSDSSQLRSSSQCKNFHSGCCICYFGSRCRFIHKQEAHDPDEDSFPFTENPPMIDKFFTSDKS